MTHPIDKYNWQQADTLATLPADQRDYMARMFRIGNTTGWPANLPKQTSRSSWQDFPRIKFAERFGLKVLGFP